MELSDIVHPDVLNATEAFDYDAAYNSITAQIENGSSDTDETLSHKINTRGYIEMQRGNFSRALEDCQKAREMNPDLDQENVRLAQLLSSSYQETFVPMMESFKEEVTAEKTAALAMTYMNAGFHPHAASYFRIAIGRAKAEEKGELYQRLAESFLGAGFVFDAHNAASISAQHSSDGDLRALSQSAAQLCSMGLTAGGFEPNDEVEHAFFNQRDYSNVIEQMHERIDLLRKGHADGDEAATLDLAEALNYRGMAYLNMQEFEAAISDLTEARHVDKSLHQLNLRLAQFIAESYHKVLQPMFEQVKKEPSAELYNEIGVIFFQNGFYGQASLYFHMAVSMSEGLVRAESFNNLAGAYLEAGLAVEALVASERAVELNPDINKVNYNVARLRLAPVLFYEKDLLGDQSLPQSH